MDVRKKPLDNSGECDKFTDKEKQVIIDALRQLRCIEKKLQGMIGRTGGC